MYILSGEYLQEHHAGLEEFKIFAPPAFQGTSDLLGVESWLGKIKQIFEMLKYSNEVSYTSFMLRGEARSWWKIEKERLDTNVAPIT